MKKLPKYQKYAIISEENVIEKFFYASRDGEPCVEGRYIKAKDFMREGMKLKEVDGKLVEDKDKKKEEKKGFWPFS